MASRSSKGKKSTHRKLTAILSADVVGYSRLMGADEEATIETLTAYRRVFTSEIKKHRGRVVDAKGDAILAEFASVVDAVNSAVETQRELAEKNAELPDERRMDFRIGINLGDVVVKDDAIYGDGVNIAARVESLAEGGGICISGSVYAQVRNKLKLEYEFLGKKDVKNIEEPVPVYRVLSVPGAAAHRVIGAKRKLAVKWRKMALAVSATVLLAVGVLLAWNHWRPAQVSEETGSGDSAVLPLPDKPSIAVLAFTNLSGDPKQEYFSDAISENIITSLSKIQRLFVTARNSSFTYKGKAVNLRQVGKELGVRYVLEGSVQKSSGRVRITAQLIDASTGKHRWAERYDGELKDIFALQDEITEKIVDALQVQLTTEEVTRVRQNTTKSVEAWENYALGMREFNQNSAESFLVARIYFEKALELDPGFGAAILGLGWTYYQQGRYPGATPDWVQTEAQPQERAAELARRALELGGPSAEPYALLGQISLAQMQHDQAISFGRRAVEQNPNGAAWHAYLAESLSYAGQPEEALQELIRARRLDPFHPDWYLVTLGRSYYLTGQYEKAAVALRNVIHKRNAAFAPIPDRRLRAYLLGRATNSTRLLLIASLVSEGSLEEARTRAADLRFESPNLRPKAMIRGTEKFRDPAVIDRILRDLAKAGLK